jgi:hypothetical protein
MVSYNPEYVVQLINSLTPENFETARQAVETKAASKDARPYGSKKTLWKIVRSSDTTGRVQKCTYCKDVLTFEDNEDSCLLCDDEFEMMTRAYPDEVAEAGQHGYPGLTALMLRIRANKNRKRGYEGDRDEFIYCREDAENLDARASYILHRHITSSFKPWWFERFDYWRQPGSTQKAPFWAKESPEETGSPELTTSSANVGTSSNPDVAQPSPCGGCTISNGFHVGTCWSEALTVGGAPPQITPILGGFQYGLPEPEPAPAPAPKPRPDYNNKYWPSPRPKLFAKSCAPQLKFRTHQDALEFLAERAKISVEDLLKMSPNTYIQEHMGHAPEYWQEVQARIPWWRND